MVDTKNLLLGLAWLGEASTAHIRRLWLPTSSPDSTERVLRELAGEGYVTCRRWASPQAGPLRPGQRRPPILQPSLWSITKKGRDQLKDEDQYPPVYKEPRSRRMAPHDSMTSEAIVRIVELARAIQTPEFQGLSGLYLEREVRLDPAKRRPVMDALIILTVGGAFPHPHLVPWSRDPKGETERRLRYALENDRGSEPLSVIRAKAGAYQGAGTPEWVRRYGRFPLVLWLAPSESRLHAINREWREAWPGGKWLLTTDAWLAGDYWLEYDQGQLRARGLFRKTPTVPPAMTLGAGLTPSGEVQHLS